MTQRRLEPRIARCLEARPTGEDGPRFIEVLQDAHFHTVSRISRKCEDRVGFPGTSQPAYQRVGTRELKPKVHSPVRSKGSASIQ